MSKRGATALRGILAVDKPTGLTSHDVVARVRRSTGEGRVGHAGTLDPAATGLLVVLIGPYTRLEPYLSRAEKTYTARITFGVETDTDDADGTSVRTAPVPDWCFDAERTREILAGFVGASLQAPPAFSAIKVAGRVAHRAARAGTPVDLAKRPIEVYEADLLATDAQTLSWDVSFRVSKGTYIRSLARDIGRACDSAAHLSALRRTTSGTLTLHDAYTLERLEEGLENGNLASYLVDPFRALGLPVVEVDVGATGTGAPLSLSTLPQAADLDTVAVAEAGRLAGVYRVEGDLLVPAVVVPEVTLP